MHDHVFLRFAWPILWVSVFFLFSAFFGWLRHRERLKAMETTRLLAEKGVALPAELAQALKPTVRERSPDRDLRAGVILVAVALAMILFAAIGGWTYGDRFHPVFGAAAFPGLLGLAFLGFWWFSRRGPRA